MTNNFEDIACANQVTNLDYLLLAGADVRYFKTVSFTHTKYMMIDGQIALVSSVNYSKTSLIKNREAGLIISQEGKRVITQFLNQVFESDFSSGLTLKTYNYTLSDWVFFFLFYFSNSFLIFNFQFFFNSIFFCFYC